MKAVISALVGGVITPGEAATIAAELVMPDLDQIKQGEQGGTGPGQMVSEEEVTHFNRSRQQRNLQPVEIRH